MIIDQAIWDVRLLNRLLTECKVFAREARRQGACWSLKETGHEQ